MPLNRANVLSWLVSFSCLSTALTVPAVSFAEGVFNGGGGGDLQPAERTEVFNLTRVAKTTKVVLRSWLTDRFFEYKQAPCPAAESDYGRLLCSSGAKLFNSKRTIFDVLETTSIELRYKGACPDADGHAKDASIHGRLAGSICLSIKNLNAKLSQVDYENQLAALVLHELSHLVGATEEEAVGLQRDILLITFQRTPEAAAWTDAFLAKDWTDSLVKNVNDWSKKIAQAKDLSNACRLTTAMADELMDHHEKWIDQGFGLIHFTTQIEATYWARYLQVRALADYHCSVDPRNTPVERAEAKARYDKAFGKKKSIAAAAYADRDLYRYVDRVSPEAVLSKISDTSSMKSEMTAVVEFFKALGKWEKTSGLVAFEVYSDDCDLKHYLFAPDMIKNCTAK